MEIDVIEKYLEEFTGNIYTKCKSDLNKIRTQFLKEFLINKHPAKFYNPYSLYCMKVLDIIDREVMKYNFFDQDEGFSATKIPHKEGNEFMSINEIYTVINELEFIPRNLKTVKQICSRTRVLAFLNVWNDKIDCDVGFEDGLNEKYLMECKLYFKSNKKYMRYARLLMLSLKEARYYEIFDFLPSTETEYRNFLKSPFVYVMLEPYNYIKESDFDKVDIVRGIVVNGSLITF